ncbi:hypothetical protein [Schaalia sp. Marseille-Q2122]|uniref:hypothetical protein n=1 Tax=Schaalia sp. Marseille-Q2122 TaxID=2736604 RepID=UPI0015898A0E|nr:hypothetical protein [Schaalia sp. Marseille-Q2122]
MHLNRKARIATWTAGLAALFTLSACAGNPGIALSVGDTVYSNDDIAEGVAQISEMAGHPVDPPLLVNSMSRAAIITELAKQNGITVADSEVVEFLKGQVEKGEFVTVPEGELATVTRDYLRLQMVSDKLGAVITDPAQAEAANELYADLLQNTPIEVNPRYGAFDLGLNLVPLTFGDVVGPHASGAH